MFIGDDYQGNMKTLNATEKLQTLVLFLHRGLRDVTGLVTI